jgi:dihydrofolate reductase
MTGGPSRGVSIALTRTQYYTAASLDGFVADPDNSLDWLFQFGSEPVGDYQGFLAAVGAIAMGSTTYEWLLAHQVFADPARPAPWPYPQPCWVFSSRERRRVPGADLRFVGGDVGPVHREMVAAAGGRNVWIMGGGDLAGQFHERGLLDEIIVTVAPVTLGGGAPLLPRRIVSPPLRLVSVAAIGGGFAELRYEISRGGG